MTTQQLNNLPDSPAKRSMLAQAARTRTALIPQPIKKQRAKRGTGKTSRRKEEMLRARSVMPVSDANSVTFFLPIYTRNVLNGSQGSLFAKAATRKSQRELIRCVLGRAEIPPLPVVVTFTRHYQGRPLDSDNLPSTQKAIRDGIADQYGVDDGAPLYRWVYRQAKGEMGVEIRIESDQSNHDG